MVDWFVPNAVNKEVYLANGKVYACNLSYTDCSANNNKFYIMQVLKDGSSFTLWIRYGRIGVDGTTIPKTFGSDSNGATWEYEKILWKKLAYGYTHVATVTIKDDAIEEAKSSKTKTKEVKSKLHP